MDDKKSQPVSALHFQEYLVEEMVFKRNMDFQDDDVEIQFGFDAKIHISPEKDKAIIDLECNIFDEDFGNNNVPFYLKMRMKGLFDCVDVEIEQFEVNAVAILLPFMRATIASFTVQTGMPAVIIPPINVYNLFKKEYQL